MSDGDDIFIPFRIYQLKIAFVAGPSKPLQWARYLFNECWHSSLARCLTSVQNRVTATLLRDPYARYSSLPWFRNHCPDPSWLQFHGTGKRPQPEEGMRPRKSCAKESLTQYGHFPKPRGFLPPGDDLHAAGFLSPALKRYLLGRGAQTTYTHFLSKIEKKQHQTPTFYAR